MEMWFLYPKEGIAISIYGLPFAAMWAVVNLACRARPHRCFARLDRVPLFLRIALLGSRNEGCIYNLPPHGEVAICAQPVVKRAEQHCNGLRLSQFLTEQPDRVGIGCTS